MRPLLFIALPLLLAACSQSAAPRPLVLEDISWSNAPADSAPQLLTLRPDHSYKITDARASSNASPRIGTYDVVAPQYGLILLDSRTAIRLTIAAGYDPTKLGGAPNPYHFAPIALTPSAAVPPNQRDHYIHIIDQYYALDSLLNTPAAGAPVAPLLPH